MNLTYFRRLSNPVAKVKNWLDFIVSNVKCSFFPLSNQQSNIAMNGKTIDMTGSESSVPGHENRFEDFKILGATELNGELHFMFTYKDQDIPQIISNKEIKIKYPQELMDFYESCMVRVPLLMFNIKRKFMFHF